MDPYSSTSPDVEMDPPVSSTTNTRGQDDPPTAYENGRANPMIPRNIFSNSPAPQSSGPNHAATSPLSSAQDFEQEKDIANRIPRLYRVFDLINEQGSGGLVDKVIIAQDGLRRLINDLSPGAYVALTREALDSLSVRPVGLYGDRIEILKFLSSLNLFDEHTLRLLQHSKDDCVGPTLRSGIYIAKPVDTTDVFYAVYWPQDRTWEDNAPSGPRRNRITFMRYLTKISEQILCFMSPAQSRAFVWDHEEKGEVDEGESGESYDEEDRLYTFEITKTNEQEETVVSRPGFRIESPLMRVPEVPESENQVCIPPAMLMLGETTQGFLSVKSLPPRIEENVLSGTFTRMRLRDLLKGSRVRIECHLSDEVISTLINVGLDAGSYQEPCADWRRRKSLVTTDIDRLRGERMAEWSKGSTEKEDVLDKEVMAFLVSKVLEKYP